MSTSRTHRTEETKRQREADMMRAMEDTRRDNEEIIRLEEEIAAQEEAARVREEMERVVSKRNACKQMKHA